MAHVCRVCSSREMSTLIDLGMSPVANNLVQSEPIMQEEPLFPLHALVCQNCSLVQIPAVVPREILFPANYLYYSSYSSSWLQHCQKFAENALQQFALGQDSFVVEVASNDGYLLQYFKNSGIRVLGVEPAAEVAAVAIKKGIETEITFLGKSSGEQIASKYGKASLICANNVLAHVPDLDDFVMGLKALLSKDGVITIEFPHIVNLIKNRQFDTIYHEHYSYLGITPLKLLFTRFELKIFRVDTIETHGGSIRVYVSHAGSDREIEPSVGQIMDLENTFDPRKELIRDRFQADVQTNVKALKSLIDELKFAGKRIAAYGAAAKGNTFLNYAKISADEIDYVIDNNPQKQDHLLPGSHIPVKARDFGEKFPPDVVLVLPWNLSAEIKQDFSAVDENILFLRTSPKVEFF